MQLQRVFKVLLALVFAELHAPVLASKAKARAKAVQTQVSSHQLRQAADPVLSQFLKELRSQADVSTQEANAVAHWCQEVRAQQANMTSVLDQELEETKQLAAQVSIKERRLKFQARKEKPMNPEEQAQLLLTSKEAARSVTVDADLAHSKREKARLKGKITGIASLVRAVSVSSQVTEVACVEEEKHHGTIAAYISAESDAANALIRQLPASRGTQAPASFLQVSAEATTRVALQRALDDFQAIQKRFPEESAWYASELDKLQDAHIAGDAASVTTASTAVAVVQEAATDSDADDQTSAEDSTSSGGAAAAVTPASTAHHMPSVDEVKSIFSQTSTHVHGKAQLVLEEQKLCQNLLKDASVDGSSLQRSLQLVADKLQSAQGLMTEYQKGVEFNVKQGKVVQASRRELKRVADEAVKQSAGTLEALRTSAQRLVSLASDMDQAQQSGSGMAKDLLQKVEEHEALLQRRAQRFASQVAKVDASDQALMQMLDEDTTRSRRNYARAKAEADLLTARAHAKADNQVLSGRFQHLMGELCSEERMNSLKEKAEALAKEEEALQQKKPKAA